MCFDRFHRRNAESDNGLALPFALFCLPKVRQDEVKPPWVAFGKGKLPRQRSSPSYLGLLRWRGSKKRSFDFILTSLHTASQRSHIRLCFIQLSLASSSNLRALLQLTPEKAAAPVNFPRC